jgi:hypothetical protein
MPLVPLPTVWLHVSWLTDGLEALFGVDEDGGGSRQVRGGEIVAGRQVARPGEVGRGRQILERRAQVAPEGSELFAHAARTTAAEDGIGGAVGVHAAFVEPSA